MVDAGKIAEIITGIMKESIEDIGNVVAADGKAIHEKTNEPPVFQKMLYGDIKLYMEENTNGKEMEVYTAVNKNNGRTEKGFAGKQKTQDGFTIKMSGKACAVILCRGGLNTGGIVI